ncbi:nitrite/sulfite reductase [Clostridium sp. B9]|uniref:nitrite/sulfite reductase n=1 Tax=Clostridium sp. B9 TaxID=3423224 RepID=UPI003D2F1057
MNTLNEIFSKEIEEFREAGHKFFNKEMTVGEFKKLSGGMGAYAHRGGQEFMVRLRVPSGVAGLDLLKEAYNWAEKYNLDKVHLTTREAIQLHGISIDAVCDIMQEGLTKGIYTRGGGGNFPRNVALNPLSGVKVGETFDVTPYALAVNNYYMQRMNTYKLPRKVKTAFSNTVEDAAHCTVTDIGFLAVNENGKECFKLYIGGGLGRNPRTSVEYDELIEAKDVLYCCEAMINLFVAEGDYKNHGKARIRYIAERMGDEGFRECFRKYFEEAKAKGGLDLSVEEIAYNKKGIKTAIKHSRLIEQKQDGLYSVLFHPIGGQLELSTLKKLIETIENIEEVEVRLGMNENLYIRNLNGKEAEEVLELTQGKGGETLAERSVACIGVPTCQMGVLESQRTLREFVELLKENAIKENSLPRVRFSGCANSCSMHEIGEIGFAGKKKRVNDVLSNVFELHFGGDLGVGKTCLGEYYGDLLQDKAPEFLIKVAKAVEAKNSTFEEWIKDNKEEFKVIFEEYNV